jgi:alkanesulfonate monooxygenase SsuD/methylene tetrahydromethanopterin reductase-like flavin-dependent oxidoreductase (luciferase family)
LPLKFPWEWDELEANGMCVAGTPATVRDYIVRQSAEAKANFFLCQMVFGELGYEDALNSLTLFADEVAPAFAQ